MLVGRDGVGEPVDEHAVGSPGRFVARRRGDVIGDGGLVVDDLVGDGVVRGPTSYIAAGRDEVARDARSGRRRYRIASSSASFHWRATECCHDP
ncbi:MAG: hypothetical protein R3B49_03290 [Phycisphaerales bacterium]